MPGDPLARRFRASCALLVLAGACGHPPVAGIPAPRGSSCTVVAPPPVPAESLVVGFAVRTSDDNGRLLPGDAGVLDALMLEPLIRIDCTGALVPALAARWHVGSAGTSWSFTLREDVAWPNGEPVTSRDVIAAWRARNAADGEARWIADSARAIDARTLLVDLPDDDVRRLGAPELAISLADTSQGVLPGTGAYRQNATDGLLTPPSRGGRLPRIHVRYATANADGRDLLDTGADVVFTDDPIIARYARSFSGFTIAPVMGRRTYLLATTRHRDSENVDRVEPGLDGLRASLADETVGVPARAASSRWWGSEATRCAGPAAGEVPLPRGSVAPRIAYRHDDPVARSIAERLVALAARPGDSVAAPLLGVTDANRNALVTAALPPAEFMRAVHDGREAAFVVSAPASPLAPCTAALALASAMPWRESADARVTPLIETGIWVIAREGAVGVTVDWGGAPRLVFAEPEIGRTRR